MVPRFEAQIQELPLEPGDAVTAGDLLAVLAAEGEDIPGGFRYCSVRTSGSNG